MKPEAGFARKTRVVKVKGHGKNRTGLVVDVNLLTGTWDVLWDDTRLCERVNPYEFDYKRNGNPNTS